MNETPVNLSPEELIMIQTIRKYRAVSGTYLDFKVEVRRNKIQRILPTFSEIIEFAKET